MKLKQVSRLVIILISISLFSCGRSQEELDAFTYLNEARELYRQHKFEEAKFKIDSISLLFPLAYDVRLRGEYLQDSIARNESRKIVESINDSIRSLTVKFYSLKNRTEQDTIEMQIERLEAERQPHRDIISFIDSEEVKRSACVQCRTSLQNARRK